MDLTTLPQLALLHPYPAYQNWWLLGEYFPQFIAGAIVPAWQELGGRISAIREYTTQYIRTVYQREPMPSVIDNFVNQHFIHPIHSGEFDALSYAFFRSAYEIMAARGGAYDLPLPQARRHFTQRVGKSFFAQIHDHLDLTLPNQLTTPTDLSDLQTNIDAVGDFLLQQGYLRDHFAFTFDVHLPHAGISQAPDQFLDVLTQNGIAYALYEMGTPIILPSAVYLYHTLGEAQHHSSRTIEELFARVGCTARETDDFDPTGFPPDRVVELWEIKTHESRVTHRETYTP